MRHSTTWRAALGAVAALLLTACQGDRALDDLPTARTETPGQVHPGSVRDEHHEARAAGPAARLQGSDDWRMTRPAEDGQIEAYTTRVSAPPGVPLELKVSTADRAFRMYAYRIGDYDGGTGHLVQRSAPVDGERQADAVFQPFGTRTVVAPWHVSLTTDTTGWDPGFYVLRLRGTSGWEYQVPYIVSSPAARGTVALVVPVTTWQAYNLWGGYSLYAGPSGDRRSWAVSFDRPYHGVGGMNDFHTAVVPIVVRAEMSGVPLSYFANVDLDAEHDLLSGALGYVSTGHDEYWTPSMRAAVESARDAGTNLAFLGANTAYWRIRLDARPTGPRRLQTGYRHDALADPLRDESPDEATSRFRDAPAPRPESSLTGMLYECYPVDADYVVVSPQWWGFRGTGVRRGSAIPGLVGGESDRVYPDRATPRPLQLLSHTAFSCRGVTTTTQSVYYTVPSGAGIFTAGTLRWGCALVDLCDRPLGTVTRDFARRVTDNLLHEFAAGPVGTRHPARDNVEDFDLPLVNTVEAS
jgi:N,N-dimethylformamidase beta subunit-like, C-terminal